MTVFRRTGTAAIRVGCRTLASPLLPFLIFVDFGEEIKLLGVTSSHKMLRVKRKRKRYLVS